MRSNLKMITSLGLVLFFIGTDWAVSTKTRLAITHGPYLVDPGEEAITIIWTTNKACVSWVEYCDGENFRTYPTWGGSAQKAMSSHHGLIDANTKLHRVRITGLKPGTKYRYRLVSKEIRQFHPYEVLFGDTVAGDIYEFKTLHSGKETFSFGVIADGHEHTGRLDSLLQQVSSLELDLMVFAGDMLNYLVDESQIFEGFIDACVHRFVREIPMVFVRGNHETRGPFARYLMDYFPHADGTFYHAFDHGTVRFIIMDSGEDKPDDHPVYAGLVDFDRYRDEQTAWLKQEIRSEAFKKAQYKIVFFHIPPYTDMDWHGALFVTEHWAPLLNEAGIDLLFSGHTHAYARMKPDSEKNTYPIVIVGPDTSVRIDVSMKHLMLTVQKKDGEIVDTFSILPKQH